MSSPLQPEPQRADSQDVAPAADDAATEVIDPADAPTQVIPEHAAAPNAAAPNAADQSAAAQGSGSETITINKRNALIAGAVGIAAAFAILGFGAGYLTGDASSDGNTVSFDQNRGGFGGMQGGPGMGGMQGGPGMGGGMPGGPGMSQNGQGTQDQQGTDQQGTDQQGTQDQLPGDQPGGGMQRMPGAGVPKGRLNRPGSDGDLVQATSASEATLSR